MTHFYTRTGDDGFTGLLGEGRVPKYHPRPQAVGGVDEASAVLGLARSMSQVEAVKAVVLQVQRDLYHMMAEISSTPENAVRFRKVDAERVSWLESQTDDFSAQTAMPREFIIPGDSQAGAAFALARTIIRRAERMVAELTHSGDIENPQLLRFLNRLSSLCFVLELVENQASGAAHPTLARKKEE